MLAGQWLADSAYGRHYSRARNLSRELAAAYDSALADADLLVLPTLPMKATLLRRVAGGNLPRRPPQIPA